MIVLQMGLVFWGTQFSLPFPPPTAPAAAAKYHGVEIGTCTVPGNAAFEREKLLVTVDHDGEHPK